MLPILNGMRHLDVLDDRFGAERVLGGSCAIMATVGAGRRDPAHERVRYPDLRRARRQPLARVEAIEALMRERDSSRS